MQVLLITTITTKRILKFCVLICFSPIFVLKFMCLCLMRIQIKITVFNCIACKQCLSTCTSKCFQWLTNSHFIKVTSLDRHLSGKSHIFLTVVLIVQRFVNFSLYNKTMFCCVFRLPYNWATHTLKECIEFLKKLHHRPPKYLVILRRQRLSFSFLTLRLTRKGKQLLQSVDRPIYYFDTF